MRKRLIVLASSIICCSVFVSAQQIVPYKDASLPIERRVDDLLSRMTLEEKIAQISHLHSWNVFDGQKLNEEKLAQFCSDKGFGFFEGFPLTAANCRETFKIIQSYMLNQTRLGIPAFSVAESLHGVVHEGTTVFPQNIAMGSTFNPDLAYRKTTAISGELNTIGVRQVLSPCIDVVRELRWGRVEESFGEDPYLCSRMAVSEAKGYLDHGISPMLKHYGPHGNPSGGLNLASTECSAKDLFDIYLKPFQTVIAETNVMAIMSSYNSWNRVPNSASHFMLTDVLRDLFGFKGYVYSDWGVINMLKNFHRTAGDDYEAAVQAITAGLDVEASSSAFPTLVQAVKEGRFDEEYINVAVRRVLRAKFELGLFEDPYQEKCSHRLPLRSEESSQLSKQIADESTVLLKNEGNLLPLDIHKLRSIAVIGPNADRIQFGDYTWSKNKGDGITPLQGIRKLVGNQVKIHYAEGCSIASMDESGIPAAVKAARKSDVALVFAGSSSTAFVRHSPEPSTSGEGIDLNDICLTGAQEKLVKAVAATGKPVVVILVAGKPFAIPWIKENIPAVLAQWYAGEQQGNSIADILFGKVNPSGRLSFSFPQSTGHLPCFYNYLPTDKGFYHEPGSYDAPGRDYVFSTPDPLWAFGHGLSYTKFDYLDAKVEKENYLPYEQIHVDVTIRNAGSRPGKEVVQVYVRDLVSTVMTPVKQLKAFQKISLEPGESKTVRLTIPVKELFLTRDDGTAYLEDGQFEIQVGKASDDILFNLPVYAGKTLPVQSISQQSTTATVQEEGEEIEVTGSVRDVQATPVAGAIVEDRGLGTRSVTDKFGNYHIKTRTQGILTFTAPHFELLEMQVNGQKSVNVQLNKK